MKPGHEEAPDDGWRYEFAIRRAMRTVFYERPATAAHSSAAPLLRMLPRPEWRSEMEQFKRCEMALVATRKLGRSDPEEMLALAVANASLAECLDPRSFPSGAVQDLQAKAYAELGNARRITNDLLHAEAAYVRAAQRARLGTGNPGLLAEIAYMAASVYRAMRRFDESILLLDRAHEVYRDLGEHHLMGCTLIGKGIAVGSRGDLPAAITLLQHGTQLIDTERAPAVLLAGIHSIIWFQVEGGHFMAGRELIHTHAELYRRFGARSERLRLRWLEGRIAAGLAEPAEAEAAFLEARAGFAEHRLAYVEALISLDLAALWLTQGRTEEVGALLAEVLGTFRALGIRREAIAVLLMLEEAANAERLTVALVGSAAASLRKLEAESGG